MSAVVIAFPAGPDLDPTPRGGAGLPDDTDRQDAYEVAA